MIAIWQEQKMDKILVKKFVGPIFNCGHHSIRLCLVVIAFLSVFSEKRCGAKSGLERPRQNSTYLLFVLVSTLATITSPGCACEKNKPHDAKDPMHDGFNKTIAGEGASPLPPA